MTVKLFNKRVLLPAAISMIAYSFTVNDTIITITSSSTTNSLIDKLTTKDTLKIIREIDGCEMHSRETLEIYKCSDSLFADLNIYLNDDIMSEKITGLVSNICALAYATFEGKIKKYTRNDYGCTSREKYTITLKTDTIEFEDQSCTFDDYEQFKVELFGKATMENYNNKTYR